MTTRNLVENLSSYKLTPAEKQNITGQNTNDGKRVIWINPSLYDNYGKVVQMNPLTGGPGTSARIDYNLPNSDNFNINNCLLEFTWNNLDGTLSQTVYNLYMLLYEIKISLNNVQLQPFENPEQIFCAISEYASQFTKDEFNTWLHSFMNTDTPLSGITVGPGASHQVRLPLLPLFNDSWKNLGRSDGLNILTVEFRFNNNYGTAVSNSRFIVSSTTSNPYTSSTISFTNIQLRFLTSKHSNSFLHQVPKNCFLLKNFDVKPLTVSWNSNSATQRFSINIDYSKRSYVYKILFYLYNTNGISAFNDADSAIIDSGLNFGVELKFRSNTVLKMDSIADNGLKKRYYIDSQYNKYNNLLDENVLTRGTNRAKYWQIASFVDLESVHNGDTNQNVVASGFPSSEQLELILTNNVSGGTYSTSCTLYCVLCYYTQARFQGGNIVWEKV